MKYIFCLFSLCSCINLLSQDTSSKKTNVAVSEIDFLNPQNTVIKTKVKYNTLHFVTIKNINKQMFNIVLNQTSVDFNTTTPGIFNAQAMPKPTTEEATPKILAESAGMGFGGNTQIENAGRTFIVEYNKTLIFYNDFVKAYNEYRKLYLSLQKSIYFFNSLNDLREVCDQPFDTIKIGVKTLSIDFLNSINSVSVLYSIDQRILKGLINETIQKLQDQADEKLKVAKDTYKAFDNQVKALKNEGDNAQDSSLKILNKTNSSANQALFHSENVRRNAGLTEWDDKLEEAKKYYSDLDKIESFVDNYITQNIKVNILKLYSTFNEINYTIKFTDLAEKDLSTITIKVDPKENTPCQIEPQVYKINVATKGGIKIDFSTGFFLSFGKKDFLDQTYHYEDIPNDDTKEKIIKDKNRNKVFPSLGALMHAYIRTGGYVQPALSFGLSLNDQTNVNYHFGASAIFGQNRRLIATFGFTLSKPQILSGQYDEGQEILKSEAPTDIPRQATNRWGNFISLTYNLPL
ncbi:MAG: hypothetical protein ABJB11_15085 [Ferruginibacter sp.]